MKLSKTEEQVMQYLWKLEKAFMKDILDQYPEPKPATTTLATLLKRMKNKGVIEYKVVGNAREYKPLVSKSNYFKNHFRGLINGFFGDSVTKFASFFTRATDLSEEELIALRKVIDQELEKKKTKS